MNTDSRIWCLTASEAAKMLNVSLPKFYRLISQGYFKAAGRNKYPYVQIYDYQNR
jgi:predicted DNA-binding transcriptional regulator AlpA